MRALFKVSRLGTIAGCMVTSGVIRRNAQVRVVRDGTEIYDTSISQLKRFKDDAREVAEGFECGILLEGYNDLKEGDILEAYETRQIERTDLDEVAAAPAPAAVAARRLVAMALKFRLMVATSVSPGDVKWYFMASWNTFIVPARGSATWPGAGLPNARSIVERDCLAMATLRLILASTASFCMSCRWASPNLHHTSPTWSRMLF